MSKTMTTRGDFAVGLFADSFNLFYVYHNTINQARAVMCFSIDSSVYNYPNNEKFIQHD